MSPGARPTHFPHCPPEHLRANPLVELQRGPDVGAAEIRTGDRLVLVRLGQTCANRAADIVHRAVLDLGSLHGRSELRLDVAVVSTFALTFGVKDVGLAESRQTPLGQPLRCAIRPYDRPASTGLALPRGRAPYLS